MMKMIIMYHMIFQCYLYFLFGPACAGTNNHKLLVISFDGFRWDYIHKANNLTNFHRMIADGGWAVHGIKNTFTTKTVPNHFTIATGLYEESHGIVGNSMYDPKLNLTFDESFEKDARNSAWWDYGGEPIWVTNQLQNTIHRSGVLGWHGGMATIKGVNAYRSEIFKESETNKMRADRIIEWFTDDYPVNLCMFYQNQPDHIGHQSGPDSREVLSKIFELDEFLGDFLYKLEKYNLLKNLNIILTSDHGMLTVSNNTDHKINLDDYIRKDSFMITSKNPVAGIHIIPYSKALEDELFNNLSRIQHADVYRAKDVPKQYHYSNNRRIPDIIVVAEEHYWISYNNSKRVAGQHGYNNSLPSMHPFFIAMGPSFKPGATVDSFNNVDIYPLMCKLLGLKPAPNNGSLDVVSQLLRNEKEYASATFGAYILILLFIGLVGGVFSVAACQVHRQYQRKRFGNGFSLPDSFNYSTSDNMPLMSDTSEDEEGL